MEKLRSKIFACFLALALVLLTTPIGLNVDTQNKSIEIQSNKAHAVVPVAGAAAAALLSEMAAAAGMTVSEFVVSTVGMIAVGTGMGIATNGGINYGNDAAVNLGNLMDAADYPAWETLSSESQEAWGNKEYYDSAKYNSLLDAFGLGDARERFYSSGGGFEFTADETDRLAQIGRIGQNWINNGSNTVDSILESLSPDTQETIVNYIGHGSFKEIDGTKINGWPSGLATDLFVNSGDYCLLKHGPRKYNDAMQIGYVQVQSTSDVYYLVCVEPSGDFRSYGIYMFSKSGFNFGWTNQNIPVDQPANLNQVSMTTQSATATYQGNTYYYGYLTSSGTGFNTKCECTMAINYINWKNRDILAVLPLLLFNDDSILDGIGPTEPNVEGYPDNIGDDGQTEIYMPALGINPNNTWNEYTTQPETPPDTGDEVDLTEIIELLKRFHFTVDYNLLVQDNPLRSAVLEIVSTLNKFKFYNVTGQLKVHDEGVYEGLGDIGGILRQIQSTLSSFFVTDTATDVIGDLDFPDLGDKAVDLVDTISTLAPFGAMLLISEVISILSQVGKIQSPSMVFDFNFMPGEQLDLVIDVSWLDDAKPVINVFCIVTLIVALAGATARLVELEAAA